MLEKKIHEKDSDRSVKEDDITHIEYSSQIFVCPTLGQWNWTSIME